MRRFVVAVAFVLAFACALGLALAARPARGHGPCMCTTSVAGRGDVVQTGPAYLVIWNPEAYWFKGGAGYLYLASAHRENAPSGVVLKRPRPRYPRRARSASFRVPRGTPHGIYVVLIFDGSEGGTHATWDHVQVVDPATGSVPVGGRLHLELSLVRDVFPPM
ncbi:MAG TPA: hypothetical protein VGW10_01915 [Solirubrobacteraceae bacterium]|nr:hypothetical protein [Solirubrobacteraceae bacterium]